MGLLVQVTSPSFVNGRLLNRGLQLETIVSWSTTFHLDYLTYSSVIPITGHLNKIWRLILKSVLFLRYTLSHDYNVVIICFAFSVDNSWVFWDKARLRGDSDKTSIRWWFQIIETKLSRIISEKKKWFRGNGPSTSGPQNYVEVSPA